MADEIKVILKHFWCYDCSRHWKTADFVKRSEMNEMDSLDGMDKMDADNPLDYYAKCPNCKEWTKAVPHYYENLPKMHTTGPRSEEGKARSALNGVKHGIYTQPHHLLAPANGKYDICEECAVKQDCAAKKLKYCPFKTDLLLRFIAAYENGDLDQLKSMSGLSQGRLYLVLESCFSEIGRTGVLLKSLKVSNGDVVYEKKTILAGTENETVVDDTDKPIFEYKANPLIDVLPKVMETAGLSSNQQKMNPAHADEADPDKLKRGQMSEEGLNNFMTNMADLIRAARGGTGQEAEIRRKSDRVHNDLNDNEDKDEAGETESAAPDNNPFKG